MEMQIVLRSEAMSAGLSHVARAKSTPLHLCKSAGSCCNFSPTATGSNELLVAQL